jgi:hypothetical protein
MVSSAELVKTKNAFEHPTRVNKVTR